MSPLRLLLTPWLHLLLLWLALLSLSWNLIAAPLAVLLPVAVGRRLGRAAISHGYRFYWGCAQASGLMRIDAGALDVLADEPGGLIIAANHPSMVDAMLIVARLPRSVCVMKAALLHNPFIGAGARLAGYIANDAAFPMVSSAVACTQEGAQLVLFPEGTRSVGGRLHPLRPGIAMIAQRAGVPIQAVIIETDSPYLGKGWPIWKLPAVPMCYRLRLGRRFAPRADVASLMAELETHLREESDPMAAR
jgi:1-acyl-sn-glycerol-3-phosphate acyltransferase